MNDKEIDEQYKQVKQLLGQKRLNEALTQLESFLWRCNRYELTSKLDMLKTSYQYMLQYMRDGAGDPERGRLHKQLLADATLLNEQCRIFLMDAESALYYHQCRRGYALNAKCPPLADVKSRLEGFYDDLTIGTLISPEKKREIIALNETALKQLFMLTWGNTQWSKEERGVAADMLASDSMQENALCLMVSAATLSVLKCFDMAKLNWLLDCCTDSRKNVSQRALVGVVCCLHLQREAVALYPEVVSRLEHLNECMDLTSDLTRIYQQILLCQETEKINRKMRDEIIPEVMKSAYAWRNSKLGQDEPDDDNDDKNPEWGGLFDDPKINDKLREMNELQMEGADVQMSTFSSLKSFSFFRDIHHWFYPFDRSQEDVEKLINGGGNGTDGGNRTGSEDKIIEALLNSGIFCDSDKYSLFFMMQQIPASQRDVMFNQLAEQHAEEMLDSDAGRSMMKKMQDDPKMISNRYLHDMYRFFRLYMFRKEFASIFNEHVELHKLHSLKPYLNNEATLAAISTFHIKKEHWEEAADMCRDIVDMGLSLSMNAELYQKMGYALQKCKRYDDAIEAYLKADTIKPDVLWTDKRLAACYRSTRQYAKALEYHFKIDEVESENAANIYYIGSCQVEMGQHDKALNTFFRLDFTESNSVRAWRGIGWCSFILGKYDQAMKHFRKVIEAKPSAGDYMNAGHAAWCMGDIKNAVGLYEKAASMLSNKEQFIDMFYKDSEYLTAKGIDEDELALMVDLL